MDLGTVFNLRELGFNLSGKASSGKLGPTGERHANAPVPGQSTFWVNPLELGQLKAAIWTRSCCATRQRSQRHSVHLHQQWHASCVKAAAEFKQVRLLHTMRRHSEVARLMRNGAVAAICGIATSARQVRLPR